jgi:hypothetical protein
MIGAIGMSGLVWQIGSIGVLSYQAIAEPINAASHRYAPLCRALERAQRTGFRLIMFTPSANHS